MARRLTQPVTKRSFQRAFTLIEVMIAMVILTSLMFIANYSYSLYSEYWHGRLGSFDSTMHYHKGLLQVKETLDSSIPYIVIDNDTQDKQDRLTFYFLGRADGLTLVTAAPIFAEDTVQAAVVRIFSEKTTDGYQLIYEEAPLKTQLLTHLAQELNFSYRTILMTLAQPIQFDYLGWPAYEHKYHPDEVKNPQPPSWRSEYDAAVTQIQPVKLRLTSGNTQLIFDLPEGHKSLLDSYIRDREKPL